MNQYQNIFKFDTSQKWDYSIKNQSLTSNRIIAVSILLHFLSDMLHQYCKRLVQLDHRYNLSLGEGRRPATGDHLLLPASVRRAAYLYTFINASAEFATRDIDRISGKDQQVRVRTGRTYRQKTIRYDQYK